MPAVRADRWVLADGPARPGFRRFGDLVAQGSTAAPPDAGLTADDPYNLIYSSGTTGDPEGIVLTHGVRAAYGTLFASAWRMTPESVVLHTGAIVFNGAFLDLMPWMFLGCTYVLHPAFDAERMIAEIERSRVTHVIMVPSQIVALLDSPAFESARLPSLQMLQSVGAPLHLEHKQRLNAALPRALLRAVRPHRGLRDRARLP